MVLQMEEKFWRPGVKPLLQVPRVGAHTAAQAAQAASGHQGARWSLEGAWCWTGTPGAGLDTVPLAYTEG